VLVGRKGRRAEMEKRNPGGVIWQGEAWAALNVGRHAYANAPKGGFWCSLTTNIPLLRHVRTVFDLDRRSAKPVRVSVTIREIVPRRGRPRKGE
jgi:hypothetical protein